MKQTIINDSEFRRRLREVRLINFERSQSGMDDLLGLGKKSWQRYESLGHLPGSQVLAALAAQGINVNWLLLGVGPKYISELSRDPIQGVAE